MKKFFLFLTLLTLSVGQMWGTAYISYNGTTQDASTTISSTNVSSGSAGAISWTGTSCTYSSSRVNIAANGTITFTASSGKVITKIVITSGSSSSYYGTWSSSPSVTPTSSSGVTTFDGLSANSVTVATSTAFRCTSASNIKIYYTASATCTTNPTVGAGSNSSVTATTARVSCASGITVLGSAGCSISSYGFVLNTTGTPTISDTKHQVGTTYTTTGTSFYKDLTGLSAETTYYVRPYATNGKGTAYGTQTSFTTPALPKDHFIDEVQGTVVADKSSAYNFSSVTIGDKSVATSGSCEQQHYHFVGWITKAKYDAGTAISNSDIQTGNKTPNNSTYYAVWAKGSGGNYTESVSWDSRYNTTTEVEGSELTIEENVTVTHNKGTNSTTCKFYTTGPGIRVYGGGNFVVTAPSALSSITLTFGSGEGSNAITANVGTYSNGSWTGNATSVTFSVGGTNGHRRIASISATYGSVSYTDYIAKCCTPLGSINGSFFGSTLFEPFSPDKFRSHVLLCNHLFSSSHHRIPPHLIYTTYISRDFEIIDYKKTFISVYC